MAQPHIACMTCSGNGGARLGISLVAQAFRSLQAPGRWPRIFASWFCSPATQSLAKARPCPVAQRCSRYSHTKGSSRSREPGSTRLFSLRKAKNWSIALVYRCLVEGWTVSSFNVPILCRFIVLSAGVAASKNRLGIPELSTNPLSPATRAISRVLISIWT